VLDVRNRRFGGAVARPRRLNLLNWQSGGVGALDPVAGAQQNLSDLYALACANVAHEQEPHETPTRFAPRSARLASDATGRRFVLDGVNRLSCVPQEPERSFLNVSLSCQAIQARHHEHVRTARRHQLQRPDECWALGDWHCAADTFLAEDFNEFQTVVADVLP